MTAPIIRAILGFSRRSHGYVKTRGEAVYNGMNGNPNFPDAPVKMSDLRAGLDRFGDAIAGSLDGGKKAFAELRAARQVVITMLHSLGHHVEVACKGDMAVFRSSGFEPVRDKGSTPDCPQPQILKIRQAESGVLLVWYTALYRRAAHYEFRSGEQGPNGEPPESFQVQTLLQGRKAVRVERLTPGKIYYFQVRAMGKNGEYTNWSDPKTRMST
jgi:hypothetical protein